MGHYAERIMHWIFPVFAIPEEREEHLIATQLRQQRVAELRQQLEEPSIEARIDNITRLLAGEEDTK